MSERRVVIEFERGPFDGTGGWLLIKDGTLVVPIGDEANRGFHIYRGRLAERADGLSGVLLRYSGWEPMPTEQEVVE